MCNNKGVVFLLLFLGFFCVFWVGFIVCVMCFDVWGCIGFFNVYGFWLWIVCCLGFIVFSVDCVDLKVCICVCIYFVVFLFVLDLNIYGVIFSCWIWNDFYIFFVFCFCMCVYFILLWLVVVVWGYNYLCWNNLFVLVGVFWGILGWEVVIVIWVMWVSIRVLWL